MDSAIDRIYSNYFRENENALSDKNILFLINKIYDIVSISIDDNVTKNYLINRIKKINEYKKKLELCKDIPVIVQRTDEWFTARKNMITASDMAQALNKGKFGNQKDFIIKKVDKLKSNENVYHNTDNPILLWGVRYEEVANRIYMKRNNVEVYEFGLIKHPNYDYFGASPDGISNLGIMLEIKCPPRRQITGAIPEQYWMQMQGQLEVCNLDECDYLECKFSEYKTEIEFMNDKNPSNDKLSNDLKEKGIIIEINNDDGTKYEYSNLDMSMEEILSWKSNTLSNLDITDEYKIYYWKLTEYFCKRVQRDINFFEENIKNLEFLWNKIKYYANDENKNEYMKNIINNKNKKGEIFNFNKNTTNNITGFAFKKIKSDII